MMEKAMKNDEKRPEARFWDSIERFPEGFRALGERLAARPDAKKIRRREFTGRN